MNGKNIKINKKKNICVMTLTLCLALGIGGVAAFAASGSLLVKFDKNRQSAKISLSNVPNDAYGVQTTFSVFPENAEVTLKPSGNGGFCVVKRSGETVNIYADSTSPLSNNGVFDFGVMSSSSKFDVGKTAELIYVDEMLQDTNENVNIAVTKPSDDSSSDSSDDKGNDNTGGGSNKDGNQNDDTKNIKSPSIQPTIRVPQNGSIKVAADGNSIIISSNAGYKIADVRINGVSVGAVENYTFDKSDQKRMVEVDFEPLLLPPTLPETLPVTVAFSDVPDSHWAKASITFAVSNGLFFGTGEDTFSPNMDMTRAMFVTVLSRFENALGEKWQVTAKDELVSFTDVADGTWYSQAVAWGSSNEIVMGIGDGVFSPEAPITREQIATILMRYSNKCGITLSKKEKAVSFADEKDISPWALSAVQAAQEAGILYGRDNGNLAPKDFASRAEVASMIERFVKNQ